MMEDDSVGKNFKDHFWVSLKIFLLLSMISRLVSLQLLNIYLHDDVDL